MKILLVNTSENTGGAAVAANRLREALSNSGVKVKMMVREKKSNDFSVVVVGSRVGKFLRFCHERFVIWLCNLLSRRNLFAVSIANTGIDITRTREFREADLIHLHWINHGMLSLKGIRKILDSGKPVVWTMHDMWPATAICHHAHECENYQSECEKCPFLRFPSRHDLAHRVWKRKFQLFQNRQVQFVAVSRWLAEKARQSKIIGNQSITTIPNSLTLSKFPLLDRQQCREKLKISASHVLVFGAARIDDPIKGFNYLTDALNIVVERGKIPRNDLHLLLFGGFRDPKMLEKLPISHTYFHYIDNEKQLSEIYSAADAVVSSSRYETFGQTLIEAQACGCVSVSFDGSGQADIIRHLDNGFLAERLSAESLADGIEWTLTNPHDRQKLRDDIARRFADHTVAAQYVELYQKVLQK
ncbi:MAG: glycosyltransferase [Prevotella sp.]|nr:glycosyltransferase [Prevotella sp.]MBR6493769.1 glycosyltransferase [Prevotella sp.]